MKEELKQIAGLSRKVVCEAAGSGLWLLGQLKDKAVSCLQCKREPEVVPPPMPVQPPGTPGCVSDLIALIDIHVTPEDTELEILGCALRQLESRMNAKA
ncbi:MAG: hypothetical protein ABFD94_18940 [Armatimonadia bacterium]